MTTLVAWFVLAYGFSNIMVYGSIFEGFRNTISLLGAKFSVFKFFSDLLSCMMCTSTWVGFFLGLVIGYQLGVEPVVKTFKPLIG